MKLANYISDLLYRYDCVIVPNFGGFIANKVSAKIDGDTHTFHPPKKQISFNTHLKHNDGLLANYIASTEGISFEEANQQISEDISVWQQQLEESEIDISTIGYLSYNDEKQLVFEPNTEINFLTESFGLSIVESPAVEREDTHSNIVPIMEEENTKAVQETTSESAETEKDTKTIKSIPVGVKYAAAAAAVLTLGVIGYRSLGSSEVTEEADLAEEQVTLEQKIQKATFIIDDPLPTINVNVEKEGGSYKTSKNRSGLKGKPFHIIAGSFQIKNNAKRKVSQLLRKGYKNARVLGENEWGLTQVTYNSYASRQAALNALETIRERDTRDAWLLIKRVR